MREIALDTETTGLSVSDGDRITEIGCVEIVDKEITGKTYHTYVNPGRELTASATDVSGLTYEFLRQFRSFKEVCSEFRDFVGNDRLVIHNASFDMMFLNNELAMIDAALLDEINVVDTLAMAKEKYPGTPATLDALCRKFSVDTKMRTKHGALIDARLLAEVYLQMSVELLQKDIFGLYINDKRQEENRKPTVERIEERTYTLSASEVENHRRLLAKIKNPIWEKFEYGQTE
jgi:DNA polymerase-3 subunit epsilon